MKTNWRIRKTDESEVKLYVEWGDKEGWILRPDITRGFYEEFPHGWFICELTEDNSGNSHLNDHNSGSSNNVFNATGCNNKVIGLLHSTKYRSQIGFIGYFVISPEYRGQGYGQKLFQHVLDNYMFKENDGGSEAQSVGLFAMEAAVPFYARHGFKQEELCVRFQGTVARSLLELTPQIDGIFSSQMDVSDLEEVALLDEKYSLAYRPGFWKNWIAGERKSLENNDCSFRSVLCRDPNGILIGMGMLGGVAQKGRCKLRLGPVYAESFEVFKAVVTHLLSTLKSEDAKTIFVDVYRGNTEACEWYEKSLGLEKILTTVYMWKGNFNLDERNMKKTYALASLDFH